MEMDVNAAAEMLDRIQPILEEMYRLAERAAQPDCNFAERMLLQRDLDAYRRRIDRIVDSYQT